MKTRPISQFSHQFLSTPEITKTTRLLFARWLHTTRQSPHRQIDPTGLTLLNFIRHHRAFIATAMKAVTRGHYQPFPAQPSVLHVDKARPYLKLSWIDRWLVGHFARLYGEAAEEHLAPHLYSYRNGYGPQRAVQDICRHLRNHKISYLLRSDILSFADTMEHRFVIADFETTTGAGAQFSELLGTFCRFPLASDSGISHLTRGVLMGSHLMLVAGNVYLSELDRALSGIAEGSYARYGDDVIFLHRDHDKTVEAWSLAQSLTNERGVSFNAHKSVIGALVKPSAIPAERSRVPRAFCQVLYLGRAVHWQGRVTLPRHKERALFTFLRRRLEHISARLPLQNPEARFAALCAQGGKMLRELRHLESGKIRLYLKQAAGEEQLRMLDLRLCEEVVRLSLQRPFRRGFFRRFPPAAIRRHGFPSLLHLRRTHAL